MLLPSDPRASLRSNTDVGVQIYPKGAGWGRGQASQVIPHQTGDNLFSPAETQNVIGFCFHRSPPTLGMSLWN